MTYEGIDLTLEAGYTKPATAITLAGRQELMDTLMLHYTLYRNKAVLDQLKSGMSALGVLDALEKYPHFLKPFFVHGAQAPLTAGKVTTLCYIEQYSMHGYYNEFPTLITINTEMIKNLFVKVHFSEAGVTERVKEEATYMFFLDLLYECEGT